MSTESSTDAEESAHAEPIRSAAWRALLELRARRSRGDPPPGAGTLGARVGEPPAELVYEPGRGWRPGPGTAPAAAVLFELYAPLVDPEARETLTIGHLGQSLDGCIATQSGDSDFVTGPENLVHMHRMRALSDAVLVGAETVAADDPQLTTRRVPGPSPVRVVIDPARRLGADHRVFTDRAAPTLLICATSAARADAALGAAEVVALDGDAPGRLSPAVILAALHARGCKRVFVEGGGETISRFLDAGVLDRLQIAVAPLVIGRGRPGVRLPAHERLADSLRLAPRVYGMGCDVLFDCDLRAVPEAHDAACDGGALSRLV